MCASGLGRISPRSEEDSTCTSSRVDLKPGTAALFTSSREANIQPRETCLLCRRLVEAKQKNGNACLEPSPNPPSIENFNPHLDLLLVQRLSSNFKVEATSAIKQGVNLGKHLGRGYEGPKDDLMQSRPGAPSRDALAPSSKARVLRR